jgi:acetyl-CoA C-acetyltransferase
LQLTDQADRRQVKDAKIGLAHNLGGSGATGVVHILKGG